eukprot:1762456-Prymnesium_polylepis.1
MAAITWGGKKQAQGLAPGYTPLGYDVKPAKDEEDARSAESNASMGPPSLVQQLTWRYRVPLNAAAELLLLLLLGVSSTVIAFTVDKSIDLLGAARARAAQDGTTFFTSYAIWTGSSLLLCTLSVAVVQYIGPSAAGSGIPQMKCVLAGVHIQDYLSLRTLVAKALSLVLALAGGLSIGKEGPYVHMASCTAQMLCSLKPFRWLGNNEHLRRARAALPRPRPARARRALRHFAVPKRPFTTAPRRTPSAHHHRRRSAVVPLSSAAGQVLAAGCAAGVSATFGAPVGGVLFSIEVRPSPPPDATLLPTHPHPGPTRTPPRQPLISHPRPVASCLSPTHLAVPTTAQ